MSDCVVSVTEENDMCMHAAQLFSPFHPIQGPAHEMVLLKFRASLPNSANPARKTSQARSDTHLSRDFRFTLVENELYHKPNTIQS